MSNTFPGMQLLGLLLIHDSCIMPKPWFTAGNANLHDPLLQCVGRTQIIANCSSQGMPRWTKHTNKTCLYMMIVKVPTNSEIQNSPSPIYEPLKNFPSYPLKNPKEQPGALCWFQGGFFRSKLPCDATPNPARVHWPFPCRSMARWWRPAMAMSTPPCQPPLGNKALWKGLINH